MKKIFMILFLSTCSVLPPNYRENLLGTWFTEITINTTSGGINVHMEQTFNDDGTYIITTNDPVNGVVTQNLTYQVGTINNFTSFFLFDNQQQVIGAPRYFSFSPDNTTLTISTNRSQALALKWRR